MSRRSDFDPASVPVRPAATVMIVDDRPDLQVLMIERNARMVFAGGMWVFPGGAVDPGEADDFEPFCDGLDDDSASALMGVEQGGLAYWVAAIRENFEEAGLLLGRKRDGSPLASDDFRSHRHMLHRNECSFLDVVREHQLMLDTSAVHYVAHWITPLGSPRRFSARFFVSSPPPGQEVTHDESETVGWSWVSPREALERHARREMVMMTPTVRMLRCLDLFDSAEAVLDSARANLPDARARVVYEPGGGHSIVLPGEPGYEEADEEKENGWVRLRPLD
ncbi:MAG: NUDIX domain-containing protein [Gammaproteobacteria bacterium]|nr:NUDIX domain-containing protein [Gammaproteobacteria bacterium]